MKDEIAFFANTCTALKLLRVCLRSFRIDSCPVGLIAPDNNPSASRLEVAARATNLSAGNVFRNARAIPVPRAGSGSAKRVEGATPEMNRVNVIVAAKSPVVLRGFTFFLEQSPEIGLAGTALALSDLIQMVHRHTPPLVIMDWELIAHNRAATAEQVRALAQQTKLILSGMSELLEDRRFALHLGARGFIDRQQTAADVADIVLRVASGRFHIGAESSEALLELEFSKREEAGRERRARARVTGRERELILAVCRGLRNKAIARELCIAEATVCHHLTSIYAKLGTRGRAELIVYAYKNGLNSQEPMDRGAVAAHDARASAGGKPSMVPPQIRNRAGAADRAEAQAGANRPRLAPSLVAPRRV